MRREASFGHGALHQFPLYVRSPGVSIQVINPDPDTAHRLVITGGQGRFPWMPMMTGRLAFSGSAL
jgi:hypothetical protein